MADPGVDRQETYLSRVATELRLHDGRTREIVDELAAHIDDATESLIGEGLDRDRAEREALARLGDPGELGRQLGAANRTTRRLLAGATGGVWAAAQAGLGGLLLGYASMILAILALMIVLSVVNAALGSDISALSTDRGWHTALLGVVLWFAAARASRAAVAIASERSARRVDTVRPWVALAGGVLTAVTVVWLWPLEHNWASVAIIVTLPIAAIAGAMSATGARPRPVRGGWHVAAALAVFVLLPLLLFTVIGTPGTVRLEALQSPTYESIEDLHRAHGYDRIATALPITWEPDLEFGSMVETVRHQPRDGWVTMTASGVTSEPDSAWRDVRLEVWAMESLETGLMPRVTGEAALATVPVQRANGQFIGAVQIDRFPGVVWAGLAMTGVGPDGARYLLVTPQVQQTAFEGTIADWFAALGR